MLIEIAKAVIYFFLLLDLCTLISFISFLTFRSIFQYCYRYYYNHHFPTDRTRSPSLSSTSSSSPLSSTLSPPPYHRHHHRLHPNHCIFQSRLTIAVNYRALARSLGLFICLCVGVCVGVRVGVHPINCAALVLLVLVLLQAHLSHRCSSQEVRQQR